MKRVALVLLIGLSPLGPKPQEEALVGTWHIIEFAMLRDGSWATTPEHQLRQSESVWDLVLTGDGRVRQTGNMRNGSLEVYDGTWSTHGSDLELTLQVHERPLELVYSYELISDDLVLRRSSPRGDMAIRVTFRKD